MRSIFDGAWDSDAAGARAVNYWWGMRSGAEEIDYSKDLPAGTLQLLDLMEKMLHEDDLRIFPEDLFAQGHVLHSPEATLYSPKELMEMDWLDECVERPAAEREWSKPEVKILAISDVPSKALWDYGTREHLEGIDLILSCGDLPQKYLEYLTNFTAAPILYVHGNHDGSYRENEPGGCICVDDSVYVWKGLRIMGLGGSIRYNNREDSFQYTEREMRRRAHKLSRRAHQVGGIDLLLTHSPAAGLNDNTDRAHKGFECFNDLMPRSAMCLRSRTRTLRSGTTRSGKSGLGCNTSQKSSPAS